MLDLCREVSELFLHDWQTVEIITDMIYVRLDITTIDAFQNAICNLDFIDRELAREIMNNLAREMK